MALAVETSQLSKSVIDFYKLILEGDMALDIYRKPNFAASASYNPSLPFMINTSYPVDSKLEIKLNQHRLLPEISRFTLANTKYTVDIADFYQNKSSQFTLAQLINLVQQQGLKKFHLIMLRLQLSLLRQLFNYFNPQLQLTNDEMLTIMWIEGQISSAKRPSLILNRGYSAQLNQISRTDLLRVLADRYPDYWANDKASLLLAVVHHIEPTDQLYLNPRRYNTYLDGSWKYLVPYRLARSDKNYQANFYSGLYQAPHRYISLASQLEVDRYIMALPEHPTTQDRKQLASQVGMLFQLDSTLQFIQSLPLYEPVLTRPANLPPPSPIISQSDIQLAKNQMTNNLSNQLVRTVNLQYLDGLKRYTDQELLDYFRLDLDQVTSRDELLLKASQRADGGASWSFQHGQCANANQLNRQTLEPRLASSNDPILSYGLDPIYRCYNLHELLAVFRLVNFGSGRVNFLFEDPDWTPGSELDREFPLTMIQQLRLFLLRESDRIATEQPSLVSLINQLLNVINQGLSIKLATFDRLDIMRDTYQQLNQKKQILFQNYVGWLFITAMWGRFWKGPGYGWPTEWSDEVVKSKFFCSDQEQVKAMNNSFSQWYNLRSYYKSSAPEVNVLAADIPIIETDFQNGRTAISSQKLDDLIQLSISGQFCLSALTNVLLSTSIYLAVFVLGLALVDLTRPTVTKLDEVAFSHLINEQYLQLAAETKKFPIKIKYFQASGHLKPSIRQIEEK